MALPSGIPASQNRQEKSTVRRASFLERIERMGTETILFGTVIVVCEGRGGKGAGADGCCESRHERQGHMFFEKLFCYNLSKITTYYKSMSCNAFSA